MPSGTSIPYHLRQNKAVDRYAFLELLAKVNKCLDIASYTYIGFGGHSLEDFKYIHAQFGNRNMISIEQSSDVFDRQNFNQPNSCIDCRHITSSDFIDSFPNTSNPCEESNVVVWLDYTTPSELRSQMEEFQSMIGKLKTQDIIKITINANASFYAAAKENMSEDEILKYRISVLKETLGNLFPSSTVEAETMRAKKFPMALCKVLSMAAEFALKGSPNLCLQPLAVFSYSDGQKMLSSTFILLEKAKLIIF